MIRRIRRLGRDTRGVATIEFAAWSAVFFMGMLIALDFGMWRTYQLRLSSAVEQGSMMAFKNRATLNGADTDAIKAYIIAAAHVPTGDVTVQATCANGTASGACVATGRQCACISGSTPTYVAAACGAACGDSTTAGYYLTISATVPYTPVVVANAALTGKTMADKVTVRLQ